MPHATRPLALALLAFGAAARATTFVVAPAGGDFTRIQDALDAAQAGDTVAVHTGVYTEKVQFPRSGTSAAGPITLAAAPGHTPVLDGTGVPGADLIRITDRSWITVRGLELRNNLAVTDGSGIRVVGSGDHIELRANRIHDLRGNNAMGITVYATAPAPIADLVIAGNEIYDAEPAPSEALTLNGNVTDFEVSDNHVHDVDNIGIDAIGGETDIQPDPAKVARNGVIRGNRVERARSSYGGGFAGGIYVDGGRDIVIEHNVVTQSDLGLEVGAENPGTTTSGIVVRNNVLHGNDKAGLVFGGFSAAVGRVRQCEFRNNVLFRNDTLGRGFGDLWIQYAEENVVRNNVVWSTTQNRPLVSYGGNFNNTIDYNLWFGDGPTAALRFTWNGQERIGLAAHQATAGQDLHSQAIDPAFVDPAGGDFHLAASSPVVNAGDPTTIVAVGETDLDGAPRLSGPRIDLGVDEITCGDGVQNPGEECDDGDATSGDGCDANCTTTRCGNGIATAGEGCDDGNLDSGDCCDGGCRLEANGSPCDDGRVCTRLDACTAGACAGATSPEPVCRSAATSQLTIKNRTPDRADALTWTWKRGDATTLGEWGAPQATTDYTVCLYDTVGATPVLARTLRLPHAGTCHGKPCWKSTGAIGFKYADRDLTPDGVATLTVKSGAAGRAGVVLKAKGVALQPPLPLTEATAVVIQLRNALGGCWGSTYAAPPVVSDAANWKDRTP